MNLALAAVGFVGTYRQEMGQVRVWGAPIPQTHAFRVWMPTLGPDAWILQSCDLTIIDIYWWPGETNA